MPDARVRVLTRARDDLSPQLETNRELGGRMNYQITREEVEPWREVSPAWMMRVLGHDRRSKHPG